MRMEADIHRRAAAGQLSARFGLTYTSDGWEDCNSTPLINSAYILANDGGVYLRSVDTSGMTKSGDYTANLMLEDIYTIGPTKVVCVVTDTCPTMRKAWKNVESEFPWISCWPNALRLASSQRHRQGARGRADSEGRDPCGRLVPCCPLLPVTTRCEHS